MNTELIISDVNGTQVSTEFLYVSAGVTVPSQVKRQETLTECRIKIIDQQHVYICKTYGYGTAYLGKNVTGYRIACRVLVPSKATLTSKSRPDSVLSTGNLN